MKCERNGCSAVMEEAEIAVAVQILKLNDTKVYGIHSKPEKPRRPELILTSDCVEASDWEQFEFRFARYKTLTKNVQ